MAKIQVSRQSGHRTAEGRSGYGSERERVTGRAFGGERRTRILRISERLLCEHGCDRLGVDDVCAAAGVSRASFYGVFSDRGELLLALFDELTRRAGAAMAVAYRGEAEWANGVRAALVELLTFLDAKPLRARFLFIGSLAGDPRMLERRAGVLAELAQALERDSPPPPAGSLPAPFGANATVGAVCAVLRARIVQEPSPSLRELCGSLMGMIVLPHLGAEAARGELARVLPVHAMRRTPVRENTGVPQETVMPYVRPATRLTYRTIGVLMAIAERPRMSNREVGRAVGVVDRGQISRLLARLRRLELIESEVSAAKRGERKAWSLTAAGSRLLAEVGLRNGELAGGDSVARGG